MKIAKNACAKPGACELVFRYLGAGFRCCSDAASAQRPGSGCARRTGPPVSIADLISAHSLTEIYSVLTRIPFKPPLYPSEAWQIIAAMILPHMEMVPSPRRNTRKSFVTVRPAVGPEGGFMMPSTCAVRKKRTAIDLHVQRERFSRPGAARPCRQNLRAMKEKTAIPKASKKTPSADQIAELASRGENISAFFSNKFTVVGPVRRVNIDLTRGMSRELDEAGSPAEHKPPGGHQDVTVGAARGTRNEPHARKAG